MSLLRAGVFAIHFYRSPDGRDLAQLFSDELHKMWIKLLFSAALFYAFVPGVLVNLSTPFTSPALTHAILFALVSGFIWKAAKPMLPKY
jgi:hypothetical protein